MTNPNSVRGVLLAALVVVIVVVSLLGQEQSRQKPLAFEVASIKPSPGCATRPRRGQGASPGRLNLECMTLRTLIENAYGVWANGVSRRSRDQLECMKS